MPRFACHSPLLEPLEQALRRISRRALAGQLDTYAPSGADQGVQEVLCAGRRPAGLLSVSVDRTESELGDYLARMAHLEAASVIAFERLADELAQHGAPAELVARARAARADEVRHAAATHGLALERGGLPVAVRTSPFAPRPLLELATENAVEGCVRESYGALVAAHQATRAKDLELRMAMRSVAPDEARHAALAHAVHTWLSERLDDAGREHVRRAQLTALFELARECAIEPAPELAEAAGLPSSGMACALLGELTKELSLPRSRAAA